MSRETYSASRPDLIDSLQAEPQDEVDSEGGRRRQLCVIFHPLATRLRERPDLPSVAAWRAPKYLNRARRCCGRSIATRPPTARASAFHAPAFRISSVSDLRQKLLQELNRIGQFEIATICGISARSVM
jgi:hypothetical protein